MSLENEEAEAASAAEAKDAAAPAENGDGGAQVEGIGGADGAPADAGADADLKGLGEGNEDEQPSGSDSIGAPESDYDYSDAKLPEGFELSQTVVGEFSKVARELNLSQKAATTLVEKVGPAIESAQKAHLEEIGKGWLKEAYADPDMGGAKWQSTISDANRALRQFAPQKVQQILAATGLNRNPDVIRMFRDIGRAVGDAQIRSGHSTPTKIDPLKRFYDNSDMN